MSDKKTSNFNKEVSKLEQEAMMDSHKTQTYKANFISEIKRGLGDEIKQNVNKPITINKKWYNGFITFIKKIFTKF